MISGLTGAIPASYVTAMPSLGRLFIHHLGRPVADGLNHLIARDSLIGDPETFDPGQFAWTGPLAEEWRTVEAELAAYEALGRAIPSIGDISPDHDPLDSKRIWKTLFLYGYGYKVPEHCAHFPRTAELVEQIPGLISAFFSRLMPGAHLYRHRGPTKSFITAHLGLRVPPEGVRIRVEDTDHRWEEGKWFIFDDCRWHEVWNDSDSPRTVLLIHAKRPTQGLGRAVQSAFLAGVKRTPFVTDAIKGLRAQGTAPVPV